MADTLPLSAPLQALAVLAHARRVQGDAARAALLYAAIDHLQPGDHAVLRGWAAAELSAQQPGQALALLQRLGDAPDVAAGLLRAQAWVALQRRDEAQQAMQAALRQRAGAAA